METNTELKMIHLSEVESQQIKWLWYPFIPYGKLSIVQGDPGDGKSTLILNIAAKLSMGECIDENMNITEPVNVIYQTAEDGLADTVKPRLEAANADCSRISIIDESDKSVSMTDDRIEEAIKRENAKLCIFDPIQAYLGGDTDMNRANEAREMTKKLGSIAERTGCAIVLIGHMNKGSGAKAAYRGMGSIDFFAVARSVMLIYLTEKERKKKDIEKRKVSMQLDYPEIVSKMAILLGAGMTIEQAWNRITASYSMKRQKKQCGIKPAYDEMIITAREISDGESGRKAYQRFSQRVDLGCYQRFIRILLQSLVKGNKGICTMLEKESDDAFKERKLLAKKLGEEASTKMLVPLMLMMIVVMAIIIAPAVLSFKG